MQQPEITPYDKNAKKHPKKQLELLARIVAEVGWRQNVEVNQKGVIVAGHGRYLAWLEFKDRYKLPDVWITNDKGDTIFGSHDTRVLTEQQEKMWRIADNQINAMTGFDMDLVVSELKDLSLPMLDLTGFSLDDIAKHSDAYNEGVKDALRDKYIIPPFSIFDTKQAYWQDRKRLWLELIGDSGEGRSDTLLGEGLKRLAQVGKSASLTGTSIFDPVLSEISYKWFNVEGGKILDPFAGGNTRGLVASILKYPYTGIDLNPDQIRVNEEKAKEIGEAPKWILGNSKDIEKLVPENDFDFIFSCPPYYDLEQYTEDPDDLSNKNSYDEFIREYTEIIKKAANKLKDNRFAVFVVSDIRDRNGNYRGFVSDTIRAFKEAGLTHYNDIILSNAIATAGLRAKNTFENTRKVVKIHQNVLVFAKGKPEEYKAAYEQLPRIESFHKNVLVFYKGEIEEIRKNYKVINTNFDYMKAGLDGINE